MSIKIEFEKENPISSLFRNHTFTTNGNVTNTGLNTGIIDSVKFGPVSPAGFHNGLPVYTQEMRMQFISVIPENLPIIDTISPFTYHRTELRWNQELETPIESDTSKASILRRTYSYYNLHSMRKLH